MIGTKSPFRSAGVLGGVVATLAGATTLIGWGLTTEDAAELGRQAEEVAQGVNAIVVLVAGLASMIGGVTATWGRLRAEKKIVLPWDRPRRPEVG